MSSDLGCRFLKVRPDNDYMINRMFNSFLASCPEYYGDITLSTFFECCNSLFVAFKEIDEVINIIGYIGTKRIHFEDSPVKEFEFYPIPKKDLYEIKFFHFDKSEDDNWVEDAARFIKESFADKNDGFAIFNPICPNGTQADMHEALIHEGFIVDDVDGSIVYIKRPYMDMQQNDVPIGNLHYTPHNY